MRAAAPGRPDRNQQPQRDPPHIDGLSQGHIALVRADGDTQGRCVLPQVHVIHAFCDDPNQLKRLPGGQDTSWRAPGRLSSSPRSSSH